MKILIIEDDPEIRNSLHDLLELHHHAVIDASNGVEGVRLAKSTLPDMIFCDIAMPAMDGYDVINAIRQHRPCSDVSFIFLTARASRSDFRHGMQSGADDYITKPFSEQDIVGAISARTRRQQPSREHVARLLAERKIVADAAWSHELMTPLCGILAGLELLESAPMPPDPVEMKKTIAIIRAGAERQHTLARKLVTYFELERLKAHPPRPSGFTSDAVASLAAGAAHVAATHGRAHDLLTRFATGSVPVRESHLIAAISELVDNALRFSKDGQTVAVSGVSNGSHYRIEVLDQGVGMTAEQRAKVDAFRQFEREHREQQGLGLGLAIARSVGELAGGRLSLTPGPGGMGLRAALELPCV